MVEILGVSEERLQRNGCRLHGIVEVKTHLQRSSTEAGQRERTVVHIAPQREQRLVVEPAALAGMLHRDASFLGRYGQLLLTRYQLVVVSQKLSRPREPGEDDDFLHRGH